jgi:hypothetical protein
MVLLTALKIASAARFAFPIFFVNMAGIARQRLMEERKSFRKNRPFGFFARPCTLPDGTQVRLLVCLLRFYVSSVFF